VEHEVHAFVIDERGRDIHLAAGGKDAGGCDQQLGCLTHPSGHRQLVLVVIVHTGEPYDGLTHAPLKIKAAVWRRRPCASHRPECEQPPVLSLGCYGMQSPFYLIGCYSPVVREAGDTACPFAFDQLESLAIRPRQARWRTHAIRIRCRRTITSWPR
jgi:hypothetical protein